MSAAGWALMAAASSRAAVMGPLRLQPSSRVVPAEEKPFEEEPDYADRNGDAAAAHRHQPRVDMARK